METELDLFAGIAVSDYERALEWYERLLGHRRPSSRTRPSPSGPSTSTAT